MSKCSYALRNTGMHGASLYSPRLLDALSALFAAHHESLTGWEWAMRGHFLNPGTVASEINKAAAASRLNWRIGCQFERSQNHRKIYRYSVVREA